MQLPPSTAKVVLSGKYAAAKDAHADLAKMIRNLEVRKVELEVSALTRELAEANRRGDRETASRLARLAPVMKQLADAERKGDRDAVARIKDLLGTLSSSRKQDD